MESSRCFSAEWTFEKGLRSVGTRGHGETRRPRRFQTTDVTRRMAQRLCRPPPPLFIGGIRGTLSAPR
jgi:hypothetical protein